MVHITQTSSKERRLRKGTNVIHMNNITLQLHNHSPGNPVSNSTLNHSSIKEGRSLCRTTRKSRVQWSVSSIARAQSLRKYHYKSVCALVDSISSQQCLLFQSSRVLRESSFSLLLISVGRDPRTLFPLSPPTVPSTVDLHM